MTEQNPYESPQVQSAETGSQSIVVEKSSKYYLIAFFMAAIVAVFFSFVFPFFAAPLFLLLSPVVLRTIRVIRQKAQSGLPLSVLEKSQFVFGSAFLTLPIGVASIIAFCCVCVQSSVVGLSLIEHLNQKYSSNLNSYFWLGPGIFLGTFVGLILGRFLLRRWDYFVK